MVKEPVASVTTRIAWSDSSTLASATGCEVWLSTTIPRRPVAAEADSDAARHTNRIRICLILFGLICYMLT